MELKALQARENRLRTIMPCELGIIAEKLIGKGFCEVPASTKYHGVHKGGLCDHSCDVADLLEDFTVKHDLKWERPESPKIVGVLHDLCKLDAYMYDEETKCWVSNPQQSPLGGHGYRSVILAQILLSLTAQEILCIRWHMGAYELEEWKNLNTATALDPCVIWTHHADMLASRRGVNPFE